MDKFLPVPTNQHAALPGDPNADLMKRVEQTLARLDEFTDLDDLIELRRRACAFTEYLRKHDESGRAMRVAQLRIMRRIGEVLAQTVRPGNPQLSKDATIGRLPKGITRTESSKWQKLAAMPEELFESYLARDKPSLNGAFKHAVRAQGDGATAHTAVCSDRDLDLLIQEGVEFRTILADPPWQYSNQATRGATDLHYPTMGTAEIAAMPIEKLAADVAQLHLWATTPLLPEAFKVIEAWGFEYKSCMVWLKSWGTGSYWRVSQEFLLFATRGEAQFPEGQHNHRSWREAPRGRHSEKPEEFRELVEAVSQAPRLELFARKPVDGWTVWGDEIEADRFHKGVKDLLDDLRDEEEEVE